MFKLRLLTGREPDGGGDTEAYVYACYAVEGRAGGVLEVLAVHDAGDDVGDGPEEHEGQGDGHQGRVPEGHDAAHLLPVQVPGTAPEPHSGVSKTRQGWDSNPRGQRPIA